ncbi:MAG: anhydro-N-acetylmuramic acid kinase, partial [Rhodospirillales bacterium]|nr:anhydro-N-acetylmuramic acid kinase [Rhodospirillales bacterium]
MAIKKVFRAIGLMSGTSSDGIDVAYLESDGLSLSLLGGWATYPYTKSFKKQLRRINSDRSNQNGIERDLTELHYRAVQDFLNSKKLNPEEIDLIGFHGHTIEHNPEESRSVQIGDGELLAQKLNITVFNNFRSNDIRHGGQGAPLAPIFHSKLAAQFE